MVVALELNATTLTTRVSRPARAGSASTVPIVTEAGIAKFVWTSAAVPSGLPIVQVYGWLFDGHGRVLVQQTPDGWNLPGGTPEPVDLDPVATLRREVMEESQVEIDSPVYLGHEVTSRHGVACALVRMTGRVKRFHPRKPDPDGGLLLGRWLMPTEQAAGLLDWGRAGAEQATAAAAAARRQWMSPTRRPTRPAEHVD